MRVLIIGHLCGYATHAAKLALEQGAKVIHVLSLEEALSGLRSGKGADLALVDIKLDIKDLIQRLKQERIALEVIACGVKCDPEEAAKAIHTGAKEYLPLPPDAELISAVLNTISKPKLAWIYADPKIAALLEKIHLISGSNAHVLITGESGTGKEMIARYIHEKSNRFEYPFISLNCAAIPEMLLESELFGHEKGAFTGATAKRIGKFEEAHRGTLLLDEISEMDLRLQAKLLRAIQEKTIDRLGGSQPISVDLRILATSNRNLLDAIKEQKFRDDLYFRLNVITIHIPPLRERIDDIKPLADHFCAKYSKLNQKESKNFSDQSYEKLMMYSWPGNVRELENMIHRAVLLAPKTVIQPEDIFETTLDLTPAASFVGQKLEDIEREVILETLAYCSGNRSYAANLLGISIRTLRNKIKEYKETSKAS